MTQPGCPLDPVPVDQVGSIRFEDPYRLLEDESPTVLRWQETLNRLARDTLQSAPAFGSTSRAVARHLGPSRRMPPKRGGDRWFHVERAEGREDAVLAAADALGADAVPLIRATDLCEGPPATFDWFAPSPDGGQVAAGVSSRGSEQGALHLM